MRRRGAEEMRSRGHEEERRRGHLCRVGYKEANQQVRQKHCIVIKMTIFFNWLVCVWIN